MHADDGESTLARFDHDERKAACHTILYLSAAGTAQSRAYKKMLTELLVRAAKMGLSLKRVAVESQTTTKLSLDQRTAQLLPKDAPCPEGTAMQKHGTITLNYMTRDNLDKLRARIGTRTAVVGRPKGAKGGGNTHKTIRIYFDAPLTASCVAELAGKKQARKGVAA